MRRLGLIAAIPAAVLGAVLVAGQAYASVGSAGVVTVGKVVSSTSRPAPISHMGTHCQMAG
jgi:hypothetical protein